MITNKDEMEENEKITDGISIKSVKQTKIELLLINQDTRGHSLHQQKINVSLNCSELELIFKCL